MYDINVGDKVTWKFDVAEWEVTETFDNSEGKIYTNTSQNPSNMMYKIKNLSTEGDTAWVPRNVIDPIKPISSGTK